MTQFLSAEREGFKVRRMEFTTPGDTSLLDPTSKRKVTICNLFVNYRQSTREIARVLDEDYRTVIGVLIEQGFIYDRRGTMRGPHPSEHRSSLFRRGIAAAKTIGWAALTDKADEDKE
jgi:hypothetical protein